MKRYLDVLWPLLAVALVGGAALLPSTSDPRPEPDLIDVVESSYACPTGRGITVASGQVKAGEQRVIRSGDDTEIAPKATDPGAWSVYSTSVPGVVVTETGREAGAEGFYSGTAGAAGGGGLIVGRCAPVIEDAWFLGLGSADRRSSTIRLANLSASPAIADLSLWGPEGQIDAIDATGIVLDPFEVRRIPVADLAAGEPLMALRVERRRGVLAASVIDASTATSSGTEPLEATRAPAKEQVVPGVTGGTRGKSLLLFNPGKRTARADVQVIGGDGPFASPGLQDLKVEPGTIRQVAVPASAGRGQQGFQVTSDQPISTSIRAAGTDDFLSMEAGLPLDGPALVPVRLGRAVTAPRLLLTAPDAAARLTLTAYDASMRELRTADVSLAASTSQVVDTRRVAAGAAYLVVEAKGTILGAATYSGDGRASSVLLRSVPATIDAPVVTPAE